MVHAADIAGPTRGTHQRQFRVTVSLTGEVRNVSPGRYGGTRVGIELVGLSEEEQSILEALNLMQVGW